MTFLGLGLVEHLPFNSVNSNMISKSHIGSVETLVWFMYTFFFFVGKEKTCYDLCILLLIETPYLIA